MNRRSFLSLLAVGTTCAVPGVAALVLHDGFERTLAAEVVKPHGVTLIKWAQVQESELLREDIIRVLTSDNEIFRAIPFKEVAQ